MQVKLISHTRGDIVTFWFDSDLEYASALFIRAVHSPESQVSQLIRIAARNSQLRRESGK